MVVEVVPFRNSFCSIWRKIVFFNLNGYYTKLQCELMRKILHEASEKGILYYHTKIQWFWPAQKVST